MLPILENLARDVLATTAAALYIATVVVAAFTAVLARSRARRRDAREVLCILLRRHGHTTRRRLKAQRRPSGTGR
jgi:hypothetical protein